MLTGLELTFMGVTWSISGLFSTPGYCLTCGKKRKGRGEKGRRGKGREQERTEGRRNKERKKDRKEEGIQGERRKEKKSLLLALNWSG